MSTSLEELQQLAIDVKRRLDEKKDLQRDLSREVNVLTDEFNRINDEIRQITELTTIAISDHAVLRYFERVLGFDIDEIKKKIVTSEVQKQIIHFGGGNFPVNNNDDLPLFRIRVRNKTVVTLLTEDDD